MKNLVEKALSECKPEKENQEIVNKRLSEINMCHNHAILNEKLKNLRDPEELSRIVKHRINELIVSDRIDEISNK